MHLLSLSPALLASLVLLISAAPAQTPAGAPQDPPQAPLPGDTTAQGLSREQMWAAPSSADWERPCLITWQRTWDDAVALSKETKKAILVCINMDGEIASEHYAGIRYRQPDIAVLYQPYVTVIGSVYRHAPADYDDEGRRILCPRFGSVTCGEHIAIEPILYEKFLDGRRISPRHIMVELDGAETYDVFHTFDTASVFGAIRTGIVEREIEPEPDTRGDRPLLERFDSTDIADRQALETAYAQSNRVMRKRLLERAVQVTEVSHVDLLRLAIFGLDVELAKIAREALANSNDESAIDLISEALRVPLEASERDALIAALERLGAAFPRAKTLAAVHRGLASRSETVDADEWGRALAAAAPPAPKADWYALESRLSGKVLEAEERGDDAQARLELAEASLALAVDPETVAGLAADARTGKKISRLMFEDVRRAGLHAQRLGLSGWRVEAVLALADYYLGDLESAYARAEVAAAQVPSGAQEWNAMAVIALFAEGRREGIAKALREKTEWPPEWLTDVHSAYAILAAHPLGDDSQVVAHHDFLRQLGARGRASRVLDKGLERFPDSWAIHERVRWSVMRERGVDGLEAKYAELLAQPGASDNLDWYAGYASLVAAEFRRRSGADALAVLAYDRAIEQFERFIAKKPEERDTPDHYIAVALAGRGRLALEREEYDVAVEQIVAALRRRPDSAAKLDGLSFSAVTTANTLMARLSEGQRFELAGKLRAALDELDPAQLRLPDFELEGPDAPNTGGAPPRRRGGRRPDGARPGGGRPGGEDQGGEAQGGGDPEPGRD